MLTGREIPDIIGKNAAADRRNPRSGVTVNGSLAGAMIVRSPGLNDDSAA